MENNFKQLVATIRRGESLVETEKNLEEVLKQCKQSETKADYLYLYALVLFKSKKFDQALLAAEEAVKIGTGANLKLNYLIAKLFVKKQNFSKALAYFETCNQAEYRKVYCRKMMIKLNYLLKNYVQVNNYVVEYGKLFLLKDCYKALRVESLYRLQLTSEAEIIRTEVAEKGRLAGFLSRLDSQFKSYPQKTVYELNYQKNLEFFKNFRMDFRPFAEVRYKVCRYIDDEVVFDTQSGLFIMAINAAGTEKSNFNLEIDDTLLIYNTDNIQVFQRLSQIFHEVDSKVYQKRISGIPVFIVEKHLENWQLMQQLFDFTELSDWNNLHFYIGTKDEDLAGLLLDEYMPFPNLLYGTELDQIKQMLEEVRVVKEENYRRRLDNLVEDYSAAETLKSEPKILIATTIYNQSLLYYGKMLQRFFKDKGLQSYLYTEQAPYYKFTKYADAKIVEEVRPGHVIHLFGVREEIEVFSLLKVPFTSWLIFDKSFASNFSSGIDQQLLFTGNPTRIDYLMSHGFKNERITNLRLPVFPETKIVNASQSFQSDNDIGIIADLDDLPTIFNNIALKVDSIRVAKELISIDRLKDILQKVYFQLYTEHFNQEFILPSDQVYSRIIKQNFERFNYNVYDAAITLIMNLFRTEIENSLSKSIQVKWVINNLNSKKIRIYGEGWEQDQSVQPFVKGNISPLEQEQLYQEIIIRNKVNLYVGNRINNHSLMHPDLINGIAAGGFFLVSGLLGKEHGQSILEPFGGLLDIYRDREEMISKINYYLENELERRDKAVQLQNLVLKEFDLNKIAANFFNYQKISNLN